MRSARAVRSPPRRPKPSTSRSAVQFSGPGSWARGPEQPLTEGRLEKACLDGLLVVVLAKHSNAVITKQQPRSLQRGLRTRRKKQPAPLIELGEEFLGTQHRAGLGMRLDARRSADHDARARDPNALPVGVRRRKRDGANGGAEAKILRHLEPPYCPLQRARRAQHAVRGIIDQHHRIARTPIDAADRGTYTSTTRTDGSPSILLLRAWLSIVTRLTEPVDPKNLRMRRTSDAAHNGHRQRMRPSALEQARGTAALLF